MIYVILFSWLFLLFIIKKSRVFFLYFIVGSVGLFIFSMYFGQAFGEYYLRLAVTYCSALLGDMTGFYEAFTKYSMLSVFHQGEVVSFYVDYECSGMIETLVYISLITFYPTYDTIRKIIYGAIGVAYIFLSNVFRIFLICSLIKIFGVELFFLSHTVVARIVFFILMLLLYYNVFTKAHILKQKVGNMSYAE